MITASTRRRRSDKGKDEMEKHDVVKPDAPPEVLATIPVAPPVEGPPSGRRELLGAHVVGAAVYRFSLERVAVDDFEEVHEWFSIALRAQLGLARLDRAGLHHDWRQPIHTSELQRAVARLCALNSFLGPVADPQAADEQS